MADEGEVSIALTPVQLYAMLNGKSISQSELASNTWHEMPLPADLRNDIRRFLGTLPEPVMTRNDAWSHQSHMSQPRRPDCWIPPPITQLDPQTAARQSAGLQLIGGMVEMGGGVLLILTPEPTMVTKIGGAALTVHGMDTTQAAIRQLFSGKPVADYTQTGGTWIAKQAGASDVAAYRVGVILDVAVPFAVGAGMVGAEKVIAIRAGRAILSEEAVAGKVGRISLDIEEENAAIGKEGGHTLDRHVNKSDAYLEGRAMNSQRANAMFSRFASKEIAESAINDAIKANRSAIQQWAANSPKANKAIDFPYGSVIGDGFSNATGAYQQLSKVRVVFKVAQKAGKTFYIVTAHPIP